MSERFPWGVVIGEHSIGPYFIKEYHPRDGEWVDYDTIIFHGYIDGKDIRRGWGSLDEALAGMIVIRSIGQNLDCIAAHFIAGIKALEKS